MEERAVLGALLGLAEEGTLQMRSHHLRAAGIVLSVGGGRFADGRQLVLRQGHARRADIGHALAKLVVRDFLQTLRCGVAEILPHRAVEMHVHQAGDDVAAGGVQHGPAAAGGGDQRAVGADVPGDEALLQVEDLPAGYPHTLTPAAFSLLPAASSTMTTTLG